jgi:Calx-beta domain
MTTVTIGQRADNSFSGLQDTHLAQQFPTSINSASDRVYVAYPVDSQAVRAIFLATGLTNIPANAVVSGASLTLFRINNAAAGKNYEVFKLLSLPTIAQATWNNRATGTPWQTAGASGASDVDPTVIATGTLPATASTVVTVSSTAFTNLVQDWISGATPNYGILMQVDAGTVVAGGQYDIASGERSTDNQRPYLTVTYDVPVPPDISVGDVTVSSASGTATFIVSLSASYTGTVTVNYATADQTASAGSDYRSASGTLTFAPGETSKQVTVDVINDGTITPLVVTNRASANDTGVAPFAVQFDATGTTSTLTTKPFHELHHEWNFGDNDSVTWAYGTRAGVAKKNRASGPIAAHVYETPGVYTVQYAAIDPLTGSIAMTTKTITVTDPDVVFAGTNTICVANGTLPVVGVNGVPTGASCQNVTTWSGVIALIASGKRILLKKGDTWTTNAVNTITGAGGGGIIGAYGTGVNPTIQLTLASSSAFRCTGTGNFIDWRIMDIDCNASGLGTGAPRNSTVFVMGSNFDATSTSSDYTTLLRCNFTQASGLILAGNQTTIADCAATVLDGGAGNVGIWCYQKTGIAILGTAVDNAALIEMNIRLQGVKKAVISECKLKDPLANGTKHTLALRGWSVASVWTGDYTEKVVVSGNEISGVSASGTVQIASVDSSSDERHRDILFERNYVKNLTNYGCCVLAAMSTSTIRNNLFEAKNGTEFAIKLDNSPAVASNSFAVLPPNNVSAYNNSYYSADVIAHGVSFLRLTSATATGLLAYNNLAYTPSYSGAKNVLNITAGSTYTEATNSSNAQMGATTPNFVATPPTTYAEWRTTTGYPVNGGTAVPVFDDFFGVQRTYPTADMGAVNP